jgi:light-regulated signal transduction histidine kinase (bacteriophytochrome)
MLKRRYGEKLGADADLSIGYAVEGAQRIDRLIKDLLAYTQVSSVSNELITPVDAAASLESALSSLRGAVAESGVSIAYDYLPQLRMHRVHLEQLLQNLIGNALKYRRKESRRSACMRSGAAGNGCLRCMITESG